MLMSHAHYVFTYLRFFKYSIGDTTMNSCDEVLNAPVLAKSVFIVESVVNYAYFRRFPEINACLVTDSVEVLNNDKYDCDW